MKQTGRRAIAGFADEQEAFEWLAGKIHLASVRFREKRFVAIRHHTNHEAVLLDSTAHVAVEHETEPTEHALLFHTLLAFEVALIRSANRSLQAISRSSRFNALHSPTAIVDWYSHFGILFAPCHPMPRLHRLHRAIVVNIIASLSRSPSVFSLRQILPRTSSSRKQ